MPAPKNSVRLQPDTIVRAGDFIEWSHDAWTTIDRGSPYVGQRAGDVSQDARRLGSPGEIRRPNR